MSSDEKKQTAIASHCVHVIFEQIAAQSPHTSALMFAGKVMSYRELNESANQLAHYLIAQQYAPETLIAICVERSMEMIIGILGILKAGCAYVPLDPASPTERLDFMLRDTAAPLILSQQKLIAQHAVFQNHTTLALDHFTSNIAEYPKHNPDLAVQANQLVYTIYTSGSTGRPKGVQIEHHQVVHLVNSQMAVVDHPVTRFLYAYSFAFDGSVLLIFWTLLQGATLVIAPEQLEKDLLRLAQFIQTHQITHLLTFPSLYRLLLDKTQGTMLRSLVSVSVAGEACPGNLVQLHHQLVPHARLLNQYGPTEATVGTTIYITPTDFSAVKTPIGRCIPGAQIYLLDDCLKEVHDGAVGEVCIGGRGVARGYLNRPELTAERFITNPFGPGRLYRSGDLARRLPSGDLDFIGRSDDQIKLRGYRIELGEIEAALHQHPNLREAVVILHGDQPENHKLVAYLVASATAPRTEQIKAFLALRLSEYMIPSTFVFLDQMPFTTNGKIDRKTLPEPARERPPLKQAFVEAEGILETLITEKWENILQISPIGRHDKFFELGGNSLQAARFIAEMQKQIGENIFVVRLFDHPTPASFAEMLKQEYTEAIQRLFNNAVDTTSASTDPALEASDFIHFNTYIPQFSIQNTPAQKNKRAIFILAPPRSGTSLLRVMLAGHPKLFAANELQLLHFDDLSQRAQAYTDKFSLWREGLIRAVMELDHCSADAAKGILQQFELESLSTAEMYEHLQQRLDNRILVDKSPSYLLDPQALQRAEQYFDRPIYIHLSRHPYAMIRSFAKMHMEQVMFLRPNAYNGQQLGELIWNQSHQNALDFLEDIPSELQFHLQYEHLVQNPEAAMHELCDHLNLEFHPDLLKPYENIEHKMTDGLYKDSKPMGDVRLLKHGRIRADLAKQSEAVTKDNFLSTKTWKVAEQLNYQHPATKKSPIPKATKSNRAVAIVGMSGRFPGAKNLEEFWKNLVSGKDVSQELDEEQMHQLGVDSEQLASPNYVRRSMILEDADCFDASYFGYLPNEAALMDPQHRIFLECAHAALEDAGCDPSRFAGKIGVFGGVARNTYLLNNVLSHPQYFQSLDDFQQGIALEKDFPATRVAYQLNLCGPAIGIQTACSSSGVAIHLACQSLFNGDSDLVLVGGGRIQPPVGGGHLHKEGHALSPDGYCRPFDQSANGMVRGHGMACIVLKPLDRAFADGDRIHAVIKATAINNDGSDKMGFTAPSIQGQAGAIQRAYEAAGISPETLSYVEAHGTGTAIGDPIEVAGLTAAFRQFTDQKSFCALGSVKSNIGHLDAGACLAGVIKTVLALQNEKIPATLHFAAPNPQIDFADTPFYVNDQLKPWPRSSIVRRAGVSSFGLGGTNVHLILEEAPVTPPTPSHKSYQLLPLSAKNEAALTRANEQFGQFFERHPKTNLARTAHTLQQGRIAHSWRDFVVAKDGQHAAELLLDSQQRRPIQAGTAPKLVFMFPGGGAQHRSMGRALYEEMPIFRDAVDECLVILKKDHQLDLDAVLFPSDATNQNQPIRDPLHAITLLFTIEYATARLMLSLGLTPSELIGHSLGEYTAACIAGVFSLKDALGLVAKRGQLFQKLPKGGMLSVAASRKQLQPLLNGTLNVAAINKPNQCVLSGAEKALDDIQQKLEQQDIRCSRLHIGVAAHSHMVEPILEEFGDFLKTIQFHPPQYSIISNVTGKVVDIDTIQSPTYWLQHLRQCVQFSDGIQTLLEKEDRIFLEIGPGQTLCTFTRQHPARRNGQLVLASLRHPKESTHDLAFLLKSLGQIWQSGHTVNWQVLHDDKRLPAVSLPTYPFERQVHWIAPKTANSEQLARLHTMVKPSQSQSEPQLNRQDLISTSIKDIFQQLSGMAPEDMDDQATFLELGFDSLFLTQAVTKIKKAFPIQINFRQLFEEAPNFLALAAYVDRQLPESFLQEELAQQQATSAPNPPIDPSTIQLLPPQLDTLPIPPDHPSRSTMEQIIQQQLQIMQQQLTLLGNAPTSQPAPHISTNHGNTVHSSHSASVPDVSKTTRSVEATPEVSHKVKKGQSFGPWNPLNKKQDQGLNEQQQQYLQDLINRYTSRTKGSQELTQAQRPHLADPRSITGFNRLWKDMVYQIAVERSKGAKLWDVDGNEYIDFRMAFGISLFGHTPDFIQEAVQKQLAKGFELGVLTPLAHRVARLLCELTGSDRATLVNTGSEAISAAIRVARTVTMKDKLVVFRGDYHGIADEMLVRVIKRGDRSVAMPVAPGIPQSAVQNVIVLDYDDPRVLERIRAHAHELAAVIIEPIQPNFPHRQPRELFHQIRQLTQEEDIALIFDEMITGFRVAPGGAQEWYDVQADLIAYGKIISGGLPMAAVAGKSRFMDAFDGGMWQYGDDSYPEAGVTFFGGTFVKHPLSLAAAEAALLEIQKCGPQLYEVLNAKTARLAKRLGDLFLETKVPLQVLSTASIIAIRPLNDNPFTPLLFYYLRLKGVHITEKAALVSTAHTEADLEFTYQAFAESIKEMQTAGFFPIHLSEVEDQNKIVGLPQAAALVPESKPAIPQADIQPATPPEQVLQKKVPLTPGQQEIWVEQQLGQGAAAAYNLSCAIELNGALYQEALEVALQDLIDRHEALRTSFSAEETVQTIHSYLPLALRVQDLSALDSEEQVKTLEDIQAAEGETAFNIFQETPYRWQLLKLDEQQHQLLFTAHHIVADGWSMGILLQELAALYTEKVSGQAAELPEPVQLSTFAQELADKQDSQAVAEALGYWTAQFADEIPILDLPTDRSRPHAKTYTAESQNLVLPASIFSALQACAKREGQTLFNLLYTAFQIFIYRLSHQQDFVLGLTAASQASMENTRLVAHGVNLLPVRLQCDPEASFSTTLQQTKNKVFDAFEHQSLAFGKLVQQLNLPRDPSRTPVISVLFNMDSPVGALKFANLQTSLTNIPRHYETFDSFINIKPIQQSAEIEWIYNTDLFDQNTINRRLEEFVCLLEHIAKQPDCPINKLNILPEKEQQQLLFEWNGLTADYPQDICLHELIEQQVEKTPDRIAISDEHGSLTYRELNERANQVAHYLIAHGVNTEVFVGVYMERSLEMVVSLLACLKVGAIYVPLDPLNPHERLAVIMEDAQADYLITQARLLDRLPDDFAQILCIDRDEARIRAASTGNLYKKLRPDHLVYVNYTSGSTGKPKGVLIPHYAVIDHHYAIIKALDLDENEIIFSVASIAFDPSVQDFFLPLLLGARVHLASENTKTDGFQLSDALQNIRPTLMQATPSTWRMLLMANWPGEERLTILCGGEGLTKDLSNKLIQRSAALYNIYGPTETTIWSTLKKLEGDRLATSLDTAYEPIGRPLQNVQIYLLDQQQQPVPIGVAGEIYVGGVGVAPEGYFKRPEMSAYHFVPNPFADTPGDTLYRTGDIARYLNNRDLEYLHRADSQVKIRGFRIELGEIESTLAQYPGIRENIVMIREDQPEIKRLVAYYIPEADTELDFEHLKAHLPQKLPDYMVPVAFVALEEFPLTATMKVNRKRLPAPENTRLSPTDTFIAPEGAFEVMIAELWQDLLGLQRISAEDDFFALGGHSIIAVKMMAQLEQKTGQKIPLSSLLENATVRRLAALVADEERVAKAASSSLVPIRKEGRKTPLFLVHGAGLHVLMFQTLAEHMDADQPLYALQARGMDGQQDPLDKMEEIAAHYIEEILAAVPDGPYALAGYSFGGLIAFEMAKQLKARGKKVDMLAMFDTIIHQSITGENTSYSYYKKLSNLGKKVAWNLSTLAKDPIPNLKYKSHILKRRYQRWVGSNQGDHNTLQEANAIYGGAVDQANKRAFDQYTITPYEGEIHLFKAKSQRFYLDDFQYLGWQPYALEGIVLHQVPGDHLTLFDPPHGAEFAKILQKSLNQIYENAT